MEFTWFVIKFLLLTFVVSGVIIFILHRTLVSSTEGAVNRLNEEIAKANAKQAELSIKIKAADEELAKRKQEAKELAEKMKSDAETESKEQREKMIQTARKESEDIIAKAQGAREMIRKELEKEMDMRAIEFSMKILNDILSEKTKGALDETLLSEFFANLQNLDMSKIGRDISTVEVVTLNALSSDKVSQLKLVLKSKLNRDVDIKSVTDPQLGGGVLLKFGSMAIDGSIKNLIRESAVEIQETVESRR